jgi:small subunit ribosomal protein S16
MPVRIRLSRGGSKKRPYYRIVIADSRRSRDGKFIDQVGTYNPMLNKENPERVKIDVEKAKEWIAKGAQPSDRVKLFLSTMGVGDKPVITEKTKQHLPKKKAQEKLAAAKEAEAAAKIAAEAPAEAPAEVTAEAPAEAPAEVTAEAPAEVTAEAPAEETAEAPAEVTAEAPAEAPAEVTAEAPAEVTAEAPAEDKKIPDA